MKIQEKLDKEFKRIKKSWGITSNIDVATARVQLTEYHNFVKDLVENE